MWKILTNVHAETLLRVPGTEELEMSEPNQKELENALHANQNLLPRSSRSFQGWQVSVMRRFSRGLC